jgi:CcmD family protein
MGQLGYLFAANAFVWAGILIYIVSLMKRNQALRRDLELLKETLEKDSDR